MFGIVNSRRVSSTWAVGVWARVAVALLLIGASSSAMAGISISPSPSTGDYTVSWTSVSNSINYTLYESTNGGSTWSASYYTSLTRSKSFTGKSSGTYTYKVHRCQEVMAGPPGERELVVICGNTWFTNTSIVVQVPIPPVPGGLTGPTTDYNGSYTISWNTSSGAASYKLQQKLGSGSWAQVYSGASTSKALSGNAAGTYYYRVQACNSSSECSSWSSTKTVTVQAAPSTPATPSGPTTDYNGAYTVSWSASTNSTSYRLQERVGSGSWTQVYSGSSLSRAVSGKSAGTYSYRVRGCNTESVCSGWSGTRTVTVQAAPSTSATPSGPTTDYNGAYTISWSSSTNSTSYRLEEKVGSGAWTQVYSGSSLSRPVSGKSAGTYSYRVRGCNTESVCSGWSGTRTVTVQAAPSTPATPTGPTSDYDGSYTIAWSASANSSSYRLEEKVGSGSWAQVYFGSSLSRAVSGKGVGTYSYRVEGCNAESVCSGWSGTKTVTVLAVPSPLTGPSSDTDGSFALSWVSIATATYYKLERRVDGGGWATILPNPTTTTHSETALLDGEWEYRVSACDGSGCSAPTATKSVDIARQPGTPASLTGPDVVAANVGTYTLNWGAAAGNVSSYELQESVHNSSSYSTIQNTAAMSRSFSPKPTAYYYYRVRACNTVGSLTSCGNWTSSIVVHAAVIIDVNLTAPAQSLTGAYTVTWTQAPVGSYNALQESMDGGPWGDIYYGVGGSFAVSGRLDGSHRYRVRLETTVGPPHEPIDIVKYSEAVTTVVGQIPEPPITFTTVAGSQPYETGVTKGGNGYIHVPIEAAPGVNGFQPSLTFVYNSGRDRQRASEQLAGDFLGYGWSLGGFSTIRRCVKGQANSNSIDLDTSDRLCLNGEPMILVSGSWWQPGSEYRTYRESFHKIVMQGSVSEPWFRVYGPDGSISEFGNTSDSQLRSINYVTQGNQTTAVPTDSYLWSINRQQDPFGNVMDFVYYEDEAAGVRHPASIRYGNNQDAEIEFQYVGRGDLEPVTLGAATLNQNLLLHTVRVVLATKTVREYRLDSETAPFSPPNNWRRLNRMQLCGFDENGITTECLTPLDFDWAEPSASLPYLKTFVERVTDSLGMVTEFTQQVVETNENPFVFSEQPFGAIVTAPDTQAIPSNGSGDHGSVVTEIRRSDGIGGWHRMSYAYSDIGRTSTKNWGYLGFYASRVTDEQSGIVTYYQYRLDAPHFAQVSAMHQYNAPFGAATEMLTRTETAFATKVGANSSIVIPYRSKITSMLHESTAPGGTPIGAVQITANPVVSGGLITDVNSTTQVAGTVSVSSAGGTFWGEVPTYALSNVERSVEADKTYANNTTGSNWLIGFQDSYITRHYDGTPTSGSLDQVQDSVFTRYGNTNRVGSQTSFQAHSDYTLTTTFGYTATGLMESQTTVGDNVASRTSSALNFTQGRYPAVFRNALNHDTSVAFDQRFGAIKSSTDPNNRQTTALFDGFGREVSRTTPDGIVITTTYDLCSSVGCTVVGTVAPVSRVRTVTQKGAAKVSPTRISYVDKLSRVIRTEVESFNGTMVRQDVEYDSQGRVSRVSQPYLATGTAYFVDYDYDIRNRLEKETRPDGSYTEITHAIEAGVGVRRTVKDRVLKADSTLLEVQERYEIYDRLGQVVESVDDSDTTDGLAVKTAYSYFASGRPKTVAVDPDGANLVTSFLFDDGGYRTSITGPDIGIVKSKYTALGELREQGYGSSGTDLLTTYGYDLLGRLKTRVDQDDTASWGYDTAASGIGLLHTRSYGTGFTETLSYNSDARVSSISTQLVAGGYNKTFNHSYIYDTNGRVDKATYPSGIQVQHSYNAYGYIDSVTDTSSSTALKTFSAIDAFGNVTQESYGNGIQTARLFDPKTGRITDIDTTLGSVVYQDNHYKWQSNGILESRRKMVGATAREESFVHDGLNRLTTATTNVSPTARTLSTNYDDRGNLLSKTSSVAADTDVTSYQYTSGTNRLSSVTIGSDVYTLSYDAYGNIRTYDRPSGSDKFIDWNARNKPSRITIGSTRDTTSPTARDEFEYGPNGQRFYKKTTWQDGVDQWIEHTFYVGAFEERITDTKDTTHKAVQKSRIGPNVLHVKTIDYLNIGDSSIEYLHRDHLGSVEAVTDEQGNQLRVLAYDPFGERRKDDWTRLLNQSEVTTLADDQRKSTSRGYTGHEGLDRTGFVHMNGRVYDPQVGRFLNPDPVVQAPTYSQNWNRYSYVMNSPVSYTDPSGFIVQGPICGGLVMCSNPQFGGAGGNARSIHVHQEIPTETTTIIIVVEISWGYESTIVYGRDGIEFRREPFVDVYVSIREVTRHGNKKVAIPDTGQSDSPIGIGDILGMVADFTPILGDMKGFYEAYKDPTPVNIAAAFLGVLGPLGDVAGKVLKTADRIGDAADTVSDLVKADVPNGAGGTLDEFAGSVTEPNRIYSSRELQRRAENPRANGSPNPNHNFPESFNDEIFKGTRTVVSDDYVLYTKRGVLNGKEGTYEIGVRPSASGRNEVITHRFFRPD